MARNEEKSHGMMNKWTAMRSGALGGKGGTVAEKKNSTTFTSSSKRMSRSV